MSSTYFNSDNKCYSNKFDNDNSLNQYLDDNFTKKNYNLILDDPAIEKCQAHAIKNDKRYFLVSDFSNVNNNFTLNCYFPKDSAYCDKSIDIKNGNNLGDYNNLGDLFRPFNNIIDGLFNNEAGFGTIDPSQFIEISGTNLNMRNVVNNVTNSDKKCFKQIKDDSAICLAKRGNFILHKMELIKNDRLDNIRYRSYNYYQNALAEKFNNTNKQNQIFDSLKTRLKNYFCESTNLASSNELTIDSALNELKDYYSKMFHELNNISSDLSNISELTTYDSLYLEELEKEINDEKRKLKELLGFDGANNGKLDDSKFIKNLVISENIILILFLVFIVVYYFKGKPIN